jgi:glycosyltransferase involved in cell wall biosynthesis
MLAARGRRMIPSPAFPTTPAPRGTAFFVIRGHRISAVIPCFNEEQGIHQVMQRIPAVVDEVVVSDNNSSDRSAEVARTNGAKVVHAPVQGYGAALKMGLAHATGDFVVTLDGDGSYPPEEIPRLVERVLDENWEFLTACRFPLSNPSAMGVTNRIGNWVLTVATRVLFQRAIKDSQSGMWVFWRSCLDRMRLTSDGMAFSEEIKIEALQKGMRFGEVHIPYGERVGEVKLQKWRDGFQNLWFLVRRRFGG